MITFGSLMRFQQIVRILARHGTAHLLGPRVARLPGLSRRLPMADQSGPVRLRMLFEDFGGTFIKFGQMLALQPDILPVEYCNALFKLLDRVEPFAYAEVERTVMEELGRPPEHIFDAIERRALATASVGQVHVAWLKGRKVAVKIQRPNVEAEFSDDIRLMAACITLIRGLRLRSLDWMIDPMEEFIGWTQEELDYRNEAGYSEHLRRLSADPSGQRIPLVHGDLTTRRTLVVEFLEGRTLLDYLRAQEEGDEVLLRRLADRGFDRNRFAANIVDNFLNDAFRHGIYHADLHPANLMILDGSVVGYIDFGITGVMSHYSRNHLMLMTLALARGDMDELYRVFMKLTIHGTDSDLPAFRAGLETLALDWFEERDGERHLVVTFSHIMTEMLHLSRRTQVMPERDIIKYIRSSIAIDGLITRFAPDFALGTYLAATCARYIRWFERRQRFSFDHLLDVAGAGGRLMESGAERGNRLVDRLAAGDIPARLRLPSRSRGADSSQWRALQLSVATLAASLFLAVGPAPAELGANLYTAQLAFAVGAFGLLLVTLRRST